MTFSVCKRRISQHKFHNNNIKAWLRSCFAWFLSIVTPPRANFSDKLFLNTKTMSDDEDGAPIIKKQRIHFGSLEAVERERLAAGPSNDNADKEEEDDEQEGEDNGVSAAVLAGIRAGNINITDGKQLVTIMEGFGELAIDITSSSVNNVIFLRSVLPSLGLSASKPSKTIAAAQRN